MKTAEVVLNPEAYGNDARISALADWLELLALHNKPIRFAALKESLKDLEYTELIELPEERLSPNDSPGPENTDRKKSLNAIDSTKQLLRERAKILGVKYPFKLDETILVKKRHSKCHDLYLALLAITVANAYGVSKPVEPTKALEATVAKCLEATGLRVVNFAEYTRAHRFDKGLELATEAIGMSADPTTAVLRTFRVDEKVDTIAHFDLLDGRIGKWSMIGQVTCAKSEQWENKISDPSPLTWQDLLNEVLQPLVFLAIPHHAETRKLHKLQKDKGRVVIDRLRLCLCDRPLVSNERKIIKAIKALPIAHPVTL